jgi:hypothetical protein
VAGIGLATAVGGTAAAVVPFAVGAAAQVKGVQVINPFVISLFGTATLIWVLLPKIKRSREV